MLKTQFFETQTFETHTFETCILHDNCQKWGFVSTSSFHVVYACILLLTLTEACMRMPCVNCIFTMWCASFQKCGSKFGTVHYENFKEIPISKVKNPLNPHFWKWHLAMYIMTLKSENTNSIFAILQNRAKHHKLYLGLVPAFDLTFIHCQPATALTFFSINHMVPNPLVSSQVPNIRANRGTIFESQKRAEFSFQDFLSSNILKFKCTKTEMLET